MTNDKDATIKDLLDLLQEIVTESKPAPGLQPGSPAHMRYQIPGRLIAKASDLLIIHGNNTRNDWTPEPQQPNRKGQDL